MTETTHEPPLLEYERERETRGAAALSWLRRLLFCWMSFQLIVAASLFDLLSSVRGWSPGLGMEVAGSPGSLLMALFAGWAGMSAIRNWDVLPRRWFIAGLVPWGLLVAQGTLLLIAIW